MKTITKEVIPLNIKNKNGRIYTREVVENALKDFTERIDKYKGVFGEFEPSRAEISLSDVSHTINRVWTEEETPQEIDLDDENWWDGPDPFEKPKCSLWAEITILDTPSGKMIQEFDEENFVVRPRSTGRVNADGTVSIGKIITFDIINKSDDAW